MARTLQSWTPFREMERIRRDFDEMFNRFFGGGGTGELESAAAIAPPLESWVEGDKMHVRADLPGVDPKEVEVTLSGNNLILRGQREARSERSEREFAHSEVVYGAFERTLMLPPGVKPEDIKASYQHGVLHLTIQMPKELSARKVPIQIEGGGDGGQRALQAGQEKAAQDKSEARK